MMGALRRREEVGLLALSIFEVRGGKPPPAVALAALATSIMSATLAGLFFFLPTLSS
jgi:hypothetical protein